MQTTLRRPLFAPASARRFRTPAAPVRLPTRAMSSTGVSAAPPPPPKLTGTARIKDLFKRYGRVAVVVHFTVYGTFLSACYLAMGRRVALARKLNEWGYLSDVEIAKVESAARESEKAESGGGEAEVGDTEAPEGASLLQRTLMGSGSTLALAFIANKALLPVRTPITVVLTPVVANFLKRMRSA